MKKIAYIAVCFSCLFALVAHAQIIHEMRTWVSAGGEHKLEAEFIGVSADGKTVTLQKKEGGRSKVELDKLSRADQQYVEKQKEAANQPQAPAQVAAPKQPNPPAQNPLQAQAPKPAVPNQAKGLSSPEAMKIGQQIDHANLFDADGSRWPRPCLDMTKSERDAIILYLLRVQQGDAPSKATEVFRHSASMGLFLMDLNSIKIRKSTAIDQYICNQVHIDHYQRTRYADSKACKYFTDMLPESNRLSGNKHSAKENERLRQQNLFK